MIKLINNPVTFSDNAVLQLSKKQNAIHSNFIKPIQVKIGSEVKQGKTYDCYFTYIPLKKILSQLYDRHGINSFDIILYADETSFTNPIGNLLV